MRTCAAALAFLPCLSAFSAVVLVDFPTENRAILEGRPQDFFMYVDRNFEGEHSKPWQGGQYGYVRGPQRSGGQVIYTALHEGIDIRPLHRDAAGNPLDPVRAAADGKVVHVSKEPGASNYGRYIVIAHQWEGCPYFTLYAHLAGTDVEPGQMVRQGETIGRMGYTGAGINKERAHVHFEVCLLLSKNFDSWHQAHFPGSPNRHGIYNGLNLVGTDPARLLIEAHENRPFSMARFLASAEPAFKITVPNSPHLSLIRDYPWLVAAGELANPPAWTLTFTRHGVPIKAEASETPVAEPVATWAKDTGQAVSHTTKGLLTGPASSPRLTASGKRFAQLLIWPGGA